MKRIRHWLVLLLCCLALALAACQQSSTEDSAEASPPASTASAEECIVEPPTEPVACTMQYDPVCGCDGNTYSNGCAAGAAGVPSSTPGACPETGANQ